MTRKTTTDFLKQARKVATPVVAIGTLDQLATAAAIANPDGGPLKPGTPVITWDCLRGLVALNDEGARAIDGVAPHHKDEPATDPGEALRLLSSVAAKTVVIMLNAHRALPHVEVVQGIQNLRDRYKSDQRTLVLLGPSFQLPAELAQDVTVFDEPLPTDEEYQAIALRLVANANANRRPGKDGAAKDPIPAPVGGEMRQVVTACRGLVAFPSEQALVLSLTPRGYDQEELWGWKKRTVESTEGLRFEYATGVQLEDVIGLDALADWTRRIGSGPRRPKAVFFMDEIEKMTAGAAGDTSGVSQAQLGSFLTWTQEKRLKGILLLGPPGVGKSYVAEAMANSLGVPILKANFNDMKGSLVGETERNMRVALKVVEAVGGTDVLLVATCNREQSLPPELRDRFSVGTWYVDLPTGPAQAKMWSWYAALPQYKGHAFGPPPAGEHFTGRDVANIVDSAWMQGCSLAEAARTSNVPVAVAQPKVIAALREAAHGVYLSAHRPGPYYQPDSDEARKDSLGGRMVSLTDEEA